jgi:hypothetical protein
MEHIRLICLNSDANVVAIADSHSGGNQNRNTVAGGNRDGNRDGCPIADSDGNRLASDHTWRRSYLPAYYN